MGNLAELGDRPDPVDEGPSVELGHHQVEQDDRWRRVEAEVLEAYRSVRKTDDLETVVGQDLRHRVADVRVVVQHQHGGPDSEADGGENLPCA
jgi:hypothetical protein